MALGLVVGDGKAVDTPNWPVAVGVRIGARPPNSVGVGVAVVVSKLSSTTRIGVPCGTPVNAMAVCDAAISTTPIPVVASGLGKLLTVGEAKGACETDRSHALNKSASTTRTISPIFLLMIFLLLQEYG